MDTTVGELGLQLGRLKTSAETAIVTMDSNNSEQNQKLGEALTKLNAKSEEFEDKTKGAVAQLELNLNEVVIKAKEEFKIQESKLAGVVALATEEFGKTREKIEDLHQKCEVSVKDLYDKFGTVAAAESAVTQIQQDLQLLYKTCETSVLSLQERVSGLEARGGEVGGYGGGKCKTGRDYIPLKNQLPGEFDAEIKKWRSWKGDVLSYLDTVTPGMKMFLEEVEAMNSAPSKDWLKAFADREQKPWVADDQVRIWRALKNMTKSGGEARKIIE